MFVLGVVFGLVQLYVAWSLSQFSHVPSVTSLLVGTVLYFPVAVAASTLPRGRRRSDVLATSLLILWSSLMLQIDVITDYHFARSLLSPPQGIASLTCHFLFLGGPGWIYAGLVALGSVDSPQDLPALAVDILRAPWVQVTGVFLLLALQLRILLMVGEMRSLAYQNLYLSFLGAFFLASLLKTLRPSSWIARVLWRPLCWASGALLWSCLFAGDREVELSQMKLWNLCTDVFAFLSPVWILRIWLVCRTPDDSIASPSRAPRGVG